MRWIKRIFNRIKEEFNLRLYNFIVTFTQKVNLFKDRLTNTSIYPNPNNYDDLTPTCEGDKDRVYSQTLKWALEKKEITNIALTGSLGSGKSSILKTFEKEHCEYQYLNISLASFKDSEENNRLIELSILQQIFYHVKHNEIPDSRFKRIKSIRIGKIIYKSLGLVLWLFSVGVFFKLSFLKNTFIWSEINGNSILLDYFNFAVFILGLIVILSKVIRLLNNAKLNKLNIQSGEIELSKDIDQSILNKHIDEILYFFEVTNFNVVIIEDLDRFKETEIFTKLRELNQLINHSKQIKRRIVFVYAIKDDKFQNGNRTKFFDFIIPVISIINPSNSGSILLEKLKGYNLSSEYIEDISLYIDDMRLLKNIYNEFTIYKNKLGELSQEKLLALIVYKNFHPSDFAELQNNKGLITSVFNKREEVIKAEIERIDIEIQNINIEIKRIEDVTLKNVEELRSLYILKIIENFPTAEKLQINDKEFSFSSLKKEEIFSELVNQENIQYYSFNRSHGRIILTSSDMPFKTIEKQVDENTSYLDRALLITSKNGNTMEDHKVKREELNSEKNSLRSMPLMQLANHKNISEVFEELKNDTLSIYLLRNGYIDENYQDYISFFYEGFITKEDRDFLFSIKNRTQLDFNFKLYKIENLLKRIRENEWQYPEVLNYHLFNFLIVNKDNHKRELDLFLKQLKNESDVTIQFIDSYIENGQNKGEFISIICKQWAQIWRFIENKSNFSSYKKDQYLKLIIENVDESTISIIDIWGELSKYISKKEDFVLLFMNELYEEKIKSTLNKLNIKLENLHYKGDSNWLIDFIYENNHYQLNYYMITFFVQFKMNQNFDKLSQSNFTVIKSTNCLTLINYIEDNINLYVENVLLKLENNTEESEESIKTLLNNVNLKFESKVLLLKKCGVIISKINDIFNKELWEMLFVNFLVKATWENLLTYYKEKGNKLDDKLIIYLNKDAIYKTLSINKLNYKSTEDPEFYKNVSLDLIKCNEISDQSFDFLIKSIPYIWSSLNLENCSRIKVKAMIVRKLLSLSTSNFTNLKTSFLPLHIDLLERYPTLFIHNHINYAIDSEDIKSLLLSKVFSIIQKIQIILSYENIIIENKVLSNYSCMLLSSYKFTNLNYNFLRNLIKFGNISDKVALFNSHFEELSKQENYVTELVRLFGIPYSKITIRGKRPLIDDNLNNRLLIRNLLAIKYISSFSTENKKLRIYNKK